MVPFVTMGDVFQWDDRVAAAAPPREPRPRAPAPTPVQIIYHLELIANGRSYI